MYVAAAAWAICGLICYAFMRRSVFNFGDPSVFVNVSIAFSAALLAFLCAANAISWDKLGLFSLVLVSYLVGLRVATMFFSRTRLRAALIQTVGRLGRTEINVILTLTAILTLILAYFAVQAGAQGDARQDFSRAFRPIVTLHSGLWFFSLIALLSPKLSKGRVLIWMCVLIIPSVAFSGKAVLLPVFYWFGMRFFIDGRRASATTISVLIGSVFIGVSIMGLIAYGASSSGDLLLLILGRLWLAGDVYIYAYQRDALTMVRADYHVSFFAYMLHPITSVFGVRGYEKPLGSMLASEVLRSSVLVGPNPHLPVLLDYFFPNQWGVMVLVSVIIGWLVMGVRLVGVRFAESRSRYLAMGGIAAAVFAPAAGFTDTSQVLIALVGIAAASVLGALAELLLRRRPAAPAGLSPHLSVE